jgi:hypothetical protein
MPPLTPTRHAWRRWRRRAPRLVRSYRSFLTACATARPTGGSRHGFAVYTAFGVWLLVRDHTVCTVFCPRPGQVRALTEEVSRDAG